MIMMGGGVRQKVIWHDQGGRVWKNDDIIGQGVLCRWHEAHFVLRDKVVSPKERYFSKGVYRVFFYYNANFEQKHFLRFVPF